MINEYLQYLNESNSGIRINPKILNMRCTRLPSEILNFARNWEFIRHDIIIKRPKSKRSLAHDDYISPKKRSNNEINGIHTSSCKEITEVVDLYKQTVNIKLINEKLLFNFYEGSDYRTHGLTWYSFKDKKIYTCHDYADHNIFFKYHDDPSNKFLFKPLSFKEWFKKWKSDKNDFDMLDYSWLMR